MFRSNTVELALGLPVYIYGFVDEVPRRCFPFKIKDLYKLYIYISSFNNESLENTLDSQSEVVALGHFLKDCFQEEKDFEGLVNAISSSNYAEIISNIKEINGLKQGKSEVDIDKTMSSVSWERSISSIQCYTSNTHNDIKEMTFGQLNSLLSYIGVVINWEYKTKLLGIVAEPKDLIKESDHPLSADVAPEFKKRLTMKDIAGFKNI